MAERELKNIQARSLTREIVQHIEKLELAAGRKISISVDDEKAVSFEVPVGKIFKGVVGIEGVLQ